MFRDSSGNTLEDYPRPSVAVDVAALTIDDGALAVVVVAGKDGPSLPGTFLHSGERLADAARRALVEKAGISGLRFRQLQMFDKPTRDPRGWVLSMAHVSVVKRSRLPESVQLCRVSAVGRPTKRLAYDHGEIVKLAVDDLHDRYAQAPDPGKLLANEFTILELRELYEAIYGGELSKDTFRRNMLPALEETSDLTVAGGGRPARLYRRRPGVQLVDAAERLGRRKT